VPKKPTLKIRNKEESFRKGNRRERIRNDASNQGKPTMSYSMERKKNLG
jgi:hypothetical protein